MKYDHCRNCREQVTWYAITNNVFLVFYKGALGVMSGCQALIADAFHSAADVIASVVTMISLKVSNQPADESHHYGHGKVQFVSSGLVGLILVTGAIFILIGAVKSIINGDYAAPDKIALLGVVVSIVANELMFRFQRCVARENNSPAIMANAWDNRSDAISSVGVLVGILFAVFGFPIADAIAAVAVGLVVVRIGAELVMEAVDGLMDAAPEMEELQAIYRAITQVPGVRGIASLRARTMGDSMHVEVDVQVPEVLKVYEGDLIVDLLQRRVMQEVAHIGEVRIHLTPVAVV
ncbi:MAG: magnetosome biogenesis CDF transporter MamB [Magnetococcus sp. WYHC-3]